MGEWSFWCSNFNCWAWWTREFQGLLAGLLAIIAGSLAFFGAYLQAREARGQAAAARAIAADERAERRRASAASIMVELSSARIPLRTNAERLCAGELTPAGLGALRLVLTPVFTKDPTVLGIFDSDRALGVASIYEAIGNWNWTLEKLKERGKPVAGDYAARFGGSAEAIADHINAELDAIAATAGLSPDELNHALMITGGTRPLDPPEALWERDFWA